MGLGEGQWMGVCLGLGEGQWLGVTQRFWLTWGVGQDEPLLNCGCGFGVGRGTVAGSG